MKQILIAIIIALIIRIVLMSNILFGKNSKTYTIRKNFNYSGIWLLKMFFIKQKPFKVEVILNESCEIKTLGVQKIFGIGDLWHHNNSDRYGFIYEGNHKFSIYTYQYRNGTLIPWKKIRTVNTNQPFYIYFNEEITNKYKIGRYLYPYFEEDGEQEKGAPHNIYIKLRFHPIQH